MEYLLLRRLDIFPGLNCVFDGVVDWIRECNSNNFFLFVHYSIACCIRYLLLWLFGWNTNFDLKSWSLNSNFNIDLVDNFIFLLQKKKQNKTQTYKLFHYNCNFSVIFAFIMRFVVQTFNGCHHKWECE